MFNISKFCKNPPFSNLFFQNFNFVQAMNLSGFRNKMRKLKKRDIKKPNKYLGKAPARKGICIKLFCKKPKKPNSAQRKCALVKFPWNNKKAEVFIPGEGHNLQPHSAILVRPGRKKDIGVKLVAIRGVYDLAGVEGRIHSKSKYGCKMAKKE